MTIAHAFRRGKKEKGKRKIKARFCSIGASNFSPQIHL
jgi:hypothetical protein